MELTYHRKGDYLFSNLTVEEEEVTIGKYGMLRRTFLKEHKNSLYQSLFLTGKLNSHLEQIEKAAQERMDNQMEKLLEKNPAPDKESDPMAWTAHMNALMATAEESINNLLWNRNFSGIKGSCPFLNLPSLFICGGIFGQR